METVSRRLQLSGGMQISTVLADLSTGGVRSFYRQGGGVGEGSEGLSMGGERYSDKQGSINRLPP